MLVIYKVFKEGSVGWPTPLFLALILEHDLLIAPCSLVKSLWMDQEFDADGAPPLGTLCNTFGDH